MNNIPEKEMSDIPVPAAEKKSTGIPRGGYLLDAWLILLLSVFCGAALAGVQIALGPKIAENKKMETYVQIPVLIEGSDVKKTEEVTLSIDGKELTIYKIFSSDQQALGWVIPAAGAGFSDQIELLLGVNADLSRVTGLYILSQKETPGLGNYITENSFTDRFKNKELNSNFEAVANTPQKESQLKAVTGATISSQSVCEIVNSAVKKVRSALKKEGLLK